MKRTHSALIQVLAFGAIVAALLIAGNIRSAEPVAPAVDPAAARITADWDKVNTAAQQANDAKRAENEQLRREIEALKAKP